MVNSNPETVSTDFDASTRLYFESLDPESVIEVFRVEGVGADVPDAFIQFGGQTPLGLATPSIKPRSGCASPASSSGLAFRSRTVARRHRSKKRSLSPTTSGTR